MTTTKNSFIASCSRLICCALLLHCSEAATAAEVQESVGEEAKCSLRAAFSPVENHVEEIDETLKEDEANEEIDEDYSGEFLDSFYTLEVQR
jgi:hypothetical protein